jgi:hypothetical protein
MAAPFFCPRPLLHPAFFAASVLATPPVFAEQVGPMPFSYTSFERLPQNESDLHWAQFFHSEPELSGDGKAFAAHISVARPDSRQEIGVFYSTRACAPVASAQGVTVSTCPARAMRFFSDGRVTGPNQIHDVCIVHRETAAPVLSDFGWNAAQVTFRVINGVPEMTTSAVLNGQLLSKCSFTIPLNATAE